MASAESMIFESAPFIPTVQELAKQPMATVPKPFLLDDQELPVDLPNSTSMATIPTIDLKHLTMSETTDFELEKLHSSCKEWGIFQVFINNFDFFF